MNLDLIGKNVVVTASTAGIGYATALAFLDEGANVLICGRNEERLVTAINNLKKGHERNTVKGYCIDLTDENAIVGFVDYVRKYFGEIDILVSNLGSGKPNSNNIYDVSEWRRVFDINLFSAVNVIDAFLPLFGEEGGSIIVTSSIAGNNRISAPTAYAASKAAINIMIRYWSIDLAKKKIRINAVAPGNVYFKGGRWEEIINDNPQIIEEYIKPEVPLGRLSSPEEVANVIVFIASNSAGFISGSVVTVDGGQTR